jgi:hypothetical protein
MYVFTELDTWDNTAVVWTVRPLHGSHRNGQKILHLFQIYQLCWEHEYIAQRNKIMSLTVTFCVFLCFISVNNCWHSTSLHHLKETAQSCEFHENVSETDRKALKPRGLCFSADQLPSSLPSCQWSSYLTWKYVCLSPHENIQKQQ